MCKPYFESRDQYIMPYYQAYAAPYVESYIRPSYEQHVSPIVDTYVVPSLQHVRPYAQQLQNRVLDPASYIIHNLYTKQLEPRIIQVKDFADSEWDKIVKPHIDELVNKIYVQYQIYLEPHVTKTVVAVHPRFLRVQSIAVDRYYRQILPTYRLLAPRVQMVYARTRVIVLTTIYPYIRWAGTNAAVFINRRIWPTVRVLYGQNVEPQLSKIKERLSSYRDSKKLEAIVNAVDHA